MAQRTRIAQQHADLAGLHGAGRATLVAGDARRVLPLFEKAGLVEDQHAVGVLCSAIIAPSPSRHLHVQPIVVVQTTKDRTGHSGDALAAWASGLADGVVIHDALCFVARWQSLAYNEGQRKDVMYRCRTVCSMSWLVH